MAQQPLGKLILASGLITVFGTFPLVAQQQSRDALAAAPAGCPDVQVAGELRKLRLELLEWRMEAQVQKVAALEQSLSALRQEQSRKQAEEAELQRKSASLDTEIAAAPAGSDARALLQIEKTDQNPAELELVREQLNTLARRDSETRQLLAGEQQRLEELKQRASRLTR